MTKNNEAFGAWCILELLGHVKLAGYVTEEERFGTKMGRIDIPIDEDGLAQGHAGPITQYFGGGSIYRLTPVTEETARAFARGNRPRPVRPYELLPEPNQPQSVQFDLGDPVSPEEMEKWS